MIVNLARMAPLAPSRKTVICASAFLDSLERTVKKVGSGRFYDEL